MCTKSKNQVICSVSEITQNLYLTSVYGATKENIKRLKITLLLNVANELTKKNIHGVESVHILLKDSPEAPISTYFNTVNDKIHEHIKRGGRVMVHCHLGISRSTTFVLAYLMKYRGMSLSNAYDFVLEKRSCIRPNLGFCEQLIDYENKLIASINCIRNYINLIKSRADSYDNQKRDESRADFRRTRIDSIQSRQFNAGNQGRALSNERNSGNSYNRYDKYYNDYQLNL